MRVLTCLMNAVLNLANQRASFLNPTLNNVSSATSPTRSNNPSDNSSILIGCSLLYVLPCYSPAVKKKIGLIGATQFPFSQHHHTVPLKRGHKGKVRGLCAKGSTNVCRWKNPKSPQFSRGRVPGNRHPTFEPKHIARLPARREHAKQRWAIILGLGAQIRTK